MEKETALGQLTTVVAILGPLVGVWLGWFLQTREKKVERKERKLSLLRARAEEIYEEALRVVDHNSDAANFQVYRSQNKEQFQSDKDTGKTHRLKVLVRLYFPDGAPLFDRYHVDYRELATMLDVIDKPRELSEHVALGTLIISEFHQKHALLVYVLCKDVRNFMDDQISLLKD